MSSLSSGHVLNHLSIPCHLPDLICPYFSSPYLLCDIGIHEHLAQGSFIFSAGIALARIKKEQKFIKQAGVLLL